MEKCSYDFYTFFSEVVRMFKCISTTDGEIYISEDKVWKVFSSGFSLDRKNEENLERNATLDPYMFTVPQKKLYLDNEYYGFLMTNAGISLDKYIKIYNPSFEEKIMILQALKKIIDFLSEHLLLHGDLRMQNVMVDHNDNNHVRLCDINNLIYPDTTYANICNLHVFWQEFYRTMGYVDKLAFDLITYILINFSNVEIASICDKPILIKEVRELLDSDNGYFKNTEFLKVKHDLVCKDEAKILKIPNTYLIDCLK